MSSICLFVFLCILYNPMQSNAMTKEEQTETKHALTTNNAFASMVSIREDYGVQPSLIYDIELAESCTKESIHLTVGPFTEYFDPAAHNAQFWDAVIFEWMDKMQSFFTSQWVVENTKDFVENQPALLYFLYICSPKTQRVLLKKIKNTDDGSNADSYNVTTYFHPILPTATTDSVIAFKFVDALSLLNNARKILGAPELRLDTTKTDKAVEVLKTLQHTICEFHNPESKEKYHGFQAEKNTGQNLQLPQNSGLYSIFAYKVPDTEDMTNYLTKFPYALVQQLLFTAYTSSIQQCNQDPSFYIQIRKDFYQLLNRGISEIGISAKMIGNRYCLLVFYFGVAQTVEKQHMATLDKSTQNKEFNFSSISARNPRHKEIMGYMATLPTLDLQKNMVRYKEEDMVGLKGVYMP